MAIDAKISDAWRNAASDLGIRVVAPVTVGTSQFEAHVLDFGSATGAIAMSDRSRLFDELTKKSYWCSVLGEIYRTYDRQLFIDTLNDWQWCGAPGKVPTWYTGTSWTP